MLNSDKLTLRNLVLAMVAGSALALAVGLRWAGHQPPIAVAEEAPAGVSAPAAAMTIAPVTRTSEREGSSVRSSAGGVPVSTTTLTSAEWDAGRPADTDTSAGAAPSSGRPPVRIFQQAPPAPVPGRVRTLADALDAGSAPEAVPAGTRGDAAVEAAPAAAPAPPPAPEATMGAGRFTTEAPPWAASAFTSNPEAGAGRFSTDWPSP